MRDSPAPIHTDADLAAYADDLFGVALRRQTWLLPMDETAVLACIAVEGIPVDPDPDDIATLADRLRQIVEMSEARSVALIWERPGGPALRMQEADWVAGIAASGAPVRAQMLSSDAGVRLLDPAFEALVA